MVHHGRVGDAPEILKTHPRHAIDLPPSHVSAGTMVQDIAASGSFSQWRFAFRC